MVIVPPLMLSQYILYFDKGLDAMISINDQNYRRNLFGRSVQC